MRSKKYKVFRTDDSVNKVVWQAIQSASQKWMMPLKDCRMEMSRFIIKYGDHLDGHISEKAFTQNPKYSLRTVYGVFLFWTTDVLCLN